MLLNMLAFVRDVKQSVIILWSLRIFFFYFIFFMNRGVSEGVLA